jgi:ribokinase
VSDSTPQLLVVGAHAPGVLIKVAHIPAAGETVLALDYSEPLDGGKGSNQALAAARLGTSVAFVGCLGKDGRGDTALALLEETGVDVRHLRRSESLPTGTGVNLLDEAGTPAMVTVLGANSELANGDLDRAFAAWPSARTLLVQLEIPVPVALHALHVGRSLGMLTMLNAAPASADVSQLSASDIDVLIVNEVEAQTLIGDDRSALGGSLAERLHVLTGIERVVVTMGEAGISAWDGSTWRLPAHRVETVDTSGAGDVFCAALATRLADTHDLKEACRWASTAAAVSVATSGTIESFPTAAQVNGFLADPVRAQSTTG